MPYHLNPEHLEKAFAGEKIGTLAFEPFSPGVLNFPSGQIVVTDPFTLADNNPMTMSVEPGFYPARMAIARYPDGDERVAYARVDFNDRKITQWVRAIPQGVDEKKYVGSSTWGCSVDSATCAIMDESSIKMMKKTRSIEDKLIAGMDSTWRSTWAWALVDTDDGSMLACSSGIGDGAYPSFFGLDGEGRVCSLATDFMIACQER